MVATIILGAIIGGYFFLAMKKTAKDIKNNQCSSCSGCSADKKASCQVKNDDK